MEIAPTLLLLFEVSQEEVRSKFDELLSKSTGIQLGQVGRTGDGSSVLLFRGLTFQCEWNPRGALVSGRRKVFSVLSDEAVRSVLAVSPHEDIAGGLAVPEIAKVFLQFGAICARILGAVAVVWRSTALQSNTDYFIEVVESYAAGGVFPVLPIVDFAFEEPGRVRSKGLMEFCGQEFELRSDLLDQHELIRRAIRLAHDLATNGAVESSQDVPDLDVACLMRLVPSDDDKLLQCRIISKTEQIVSLC